MRVPAWAVASTVVLVVAGSVWLVSTRTRPSFAVYDSVPSAAPARSAPSRDPASAPVPDRTATGAAPETQPRQSRKRPVPRPVTATAPSDGDTAATRPHRSDNYGGYSGYGSRERRRPPNGK